MDFWKYYCFNQHRQHFLNQQSLLDLASSNSTHEKDVHARLLFSFIFFHKYDILMGVMFMQKHGFFLFYLPRPFKM